MTNLLTYPQGSYKAKKSLAYDIANFMMYLKPFETTIDGITYNLCPFASLGCSLACLNTAGRGNFDAVKQARLNRTILYITDRREFLRQLEAEITKAINWSNNKGLTPVFRLNGTSDLPFHKMDAMQKFPDIQFYDYTKIKKKILNNNLPNYQLTFSLSEDNEKEAVEVLKAGFNVAVVFNEIPKTYTLGNIAYKVLNGDKTDLRYLDNQGVIVGLIAKGRARKDDTGFVRN